MKKHGLAVTCTDSATFPVRCYTSCSVVSPETAQGHRWARCPPALPPRRCWFAIVGHGWPCRGSGTARRPLGQLGGGAPSASALSGGSGGAEAPAAAICTLLGVVGSGRAAADAAPADHWRGMLARCLDRRAAGACPLLLLAAAVRRAAGRCGGRERHCEGTPWALLLLDWQHLLLQQHTPGAWEPPGSPAPRGPPPIRIPAPRTRHPPPSLHPPAAPTLRLLLSCCACLQPTSPPD